MFIGNRLFNRACRYRTRGNGCELREGRFRLGIRKAFFYKGGETREWVAPRGSE